MPRTDLDDPPVRQAPASRGFAAAVQPIAQQTIETLGQQLGVGEGETTKDGRFSLHTARCIGACALAPAITVGDDVFGKMTYDKIQHFCQKDLKKYV